MGLQVNVTENWYISSNYCVWYYRYISNYLLSSIITYYHPLSSISSITIHYHPLSSIVYGRYISTISYLQVLSQKFLVNSLEPLQTSDGNAPEVIQIHKLMGYSGIYLGNILGIYYDILGYLQYSWGILIWEISSISWEIS